MGDILGSIFGGGQQSQQNTAVDPVTSNLNKIKLDQVMTMLGYPGASGTGSSGFLSPNNAYAPSSKVDDLLGYGFGTPSDGNQFNLDNYLKMGSNLGTDFSQQNKAQTDELLNSGLTNAQGATTNALQSIADTTTANRDDSANRFTSAYNTAYQTGLGGVNNYISQIAAPQIKQALALQGLEGGGALPEAIGKATASTALPYMQSLIPMLQQYLSEQANIGQAGQQQQAALLGQGNQAQASLYGTALPTEAQGMLGAQQLAQGTLGSFVQSTPGAASTLGLLPTQQQAGRANVASTLFPLADYGRNLQEQDLLRRQGLVQTAMTGIPYTPQTNVKQSTNQQPLFNFFGQG